MRIWLATKDAVKGDRVRNDANNFMINELGLHPGAYQPNNTFWKKHDVVNETIRMVIENFPEDYVPVPPDEAPTED